MNTRLAATLVIGFWVVWFAGKLRVAGRAWWASPFLPALVILVGALVVVWLPD